MKLIIQIPCYNEEDTLPLTLSELPRHVPGFEEVEWLVINDGSNDKTVKVANENGVDHVISYTSNRGLAHAFRIGLQACLDRGADVIVHTDADNQYAASSIPDLVLPVLRDEADLVVGDRQVWKHQEFGWGKRFLQDLGSKVVSHLSRISVPDVTSGFRAFSREAALTLNVLSRYTYTHETIIQAGMQNLKVVSVPVKVNPATRPSRLFRSQTAYVLRSAATILRVYTMYRALRVLLTIATPIFLAGFGLGIRFLYFYMTGNGSGHIQSLILCAVLLNLSFFLALIGILADLIGCNRRIIEDLLLQTKLIRNYSRDNKNT